MRFSFTDDQLALRAAVRRVLDHECTVAELRQIARSDLSGGERRWSVLAELGAVGLLAAETDGGMGLTEVELVGVLEETGWAALPDPFAESAALAVPLLAGSPVLERVAGGATKATVGGIDVSVTAPRAPGRNLDGRRRTERVVGASRADLLLLFARSDDKGWELHVIDRADVDVRPTPSIDPTRDIGTVEWTPSATSLIASGDEATVLAAATGRPRRGRNGCPVARSLGPDDHHDRRLRQGAPPIRPADRQLPSGETPTGRRPGRLEFARPTTYRAAYSLSRRAPTASHDASMAKAMASDAADLAARVALQVHGAIGYTWECDLHLFMKRAWVLSASWGDAGTHRARVLAAALAARSR